VLQKFPDDDFGDAPQEEAMVTSTILPEPLIPVEQSLLDSVQHIQWYM